MNRECRWIFQIFGSPTHPPFERSFGCLKGEGTARAAFSSCFGDVVLFVHLQFVYFFVSHEHAWELVCSCTEIGIPYKTKYWGESPHVFCWTVTLHPPYLKRAIVIRTVFFIHSTYLVRQQFIGKFSQFRFETCSTYSVLSLVPTFRRAVKCLH